MVNKDGQQGFGEVKQKHLQAYYRDLGLCYFAEMLQKSKDAEPGVWEMGDSECLFKYE